MASSIEPPKTSPSSLPQKPENWIPGAALTVMAVVAAYWLLSTNHITAICQQGYDPLGHWQLSALVAALPVIVLLGALAFGHVKAHYAALAGLVTALLIAVYLFHMPG